MGKAVYLTTRQIELLQRVLAPENFSSESGDEEYDIQTYEDRDEILEKLNRDKRHRLWRVQAEKSYSEIDWKKYDPEFPPTDQVRYLISDGVHVDWGIYQFGEWYPEDNSEVERVTLYAVVGLPRVT